MKNAVKVVDSLIAEDHPEAKLKFTTGYKPELGNVTPDLHKEIGLRFLQLVGILRWAVQLGRMDIYVVLSQLSQHQALPRRGHFDAIHYIFANLKKDENGAWIVFDPKTPQIDERVYGDGTKELLPNMLKPRGQPVVVSCFVDANHAGIVIMCRSHTGIIIYVQNAPII